MLLTLFCTTAGMLTLNGCTIQVPVDVKDEPLYFDKGASGARQDFFLSPGGVDLTKEEWDATRFGMVCMGASSFEDFKTELEDLCTQIICNYQAQQAVTALKKVISTIHETTMLK